MTPERVKGFFDALTPLLESKALALLLALSFGGAVYLIADAALERQRQMVQTLYEQVMKLHTEHVELAKLAGKCAP